MTATKKTKKTKKTLTWENIKKLIEAQCYEFDKMIFGICEDPDDFTYGKKWQSGPMWHTMNLSFGPPRI